MPYAPPVTRLKNKQAISSSVARLISGLAIGSHHSEYGCPSTHSTDCVSMAPFLGAHIHDFHRTGTLSTAVSATWATLCCRLINCGLQAVHGGAWFLGRFRQHHHQNYWLLQWIVIPEVERWVTRSGWSGTSFMSGKTSHPDAYNSS